jgi:hypothetical protein
VDERHPELKSEEIRVCRVTVGCGKRTENMQSVDESPFRVWPTQFLARQTWTQSQLAAEHNIEGFTTQMVEVGPVKKARVHDGDHWAEKGTRLVKLVDRRCVDLEKHVTHTAHLEKEARRPCCSICDKGVNGSRQAAPETKAPRQTPKPAHMDCGGPGGCGSLHRCLFLSRRGRGAAMPPQRLSPRPLFSSILVRRNRCGSVVERYKP